MPASSVRMPSSSVSPSSPFLLGAGVCPQAAPAAISSAGQRGCQTGRPSPAARQLLAEATRAAVRGLPSLLRKATSRDRRGARRRRKRRLNRAVLMLVPVSTGPYRTKIRRITRRKAVAAHLDVTLRPQAPVDPLPVILRFPVPLPDGREPLTRQVRPCRQPCPPAGSPGPGADTSFHVTHSPPAFARLARLAFVAGRRRGDRQHRGLAHGAPSPTRRPIRRTKGNLAYPATAAAFREHVADRVADARAPAREAHRGTTHVPASEGRTRCARTSRWPSPRSTPRWTRSAPMAP